MVTNIRMQKYVLSVLRITTELEIQGLSNAIPYRNRIIYAYCIYNATV